MITTHLKPGRAPRLLGVFSFRYDSHLVPAMLANIDPLTDGWVAYDDSSGEGLISNEVRRRTALLQTARDAGARWALAIDPDERFETGLAAEIRQLTEPDICPHAFTFAVREMYGADHYRVDGIWRHKRQARLLSLANGVTAPAGDLHLSWASFIPNAQVRDTHYNLYHLKMITPERRKARAALYEHLDPGHRMQAIGYAYLGDDAGAEFEPIAEGRGYHPPHEEDGGLWMPSVDEPNGSQSSASSG